jgi:hypothetical protein
VLNSFTSTLFISLTVLPFGNPCYEVYGISRLNVGRSELDSWLEQGFITFRPAELFIHPSVHCVPRALSPEIRGPGREVEYAHPYFAEDKNTWSYSSTPSYFFTVWYLIKHIYSFVVSRSIINLNSKPNKVVVLKTVPVTKTISNCNCHELNYSVALMKISKFCEHKLLSDVSIVQIPKFLGSNHDSVITVVF